MKKILLIAVMAILGLSASAQQVEQGFRMGVRANVGVSNLLGDEGNKFTVGYGIGWVAEYNFNPNLYLQSGINFQNIAHKEDLLDGTLNAFYGQIPIHVGYRFELGETTSMFVQAGPTIACGLFGTKISYGIGETNYFDVARRFDLGVGGRVGVEFNKFQISAGTNYGVINAFEGVGGHNISINLGIGYMF